MLPLLALSALLGSALADKVAFSCAGRYPGLHGNPGAECSVYYFACQGGSSAAIKLACPRGNLFNKRTQRCNPASQISGCERFAPQAAPPPPPPAPRPQPKFIPRSPPAKFIPRKFIPQSPPAKFIPRKFIPRSPPAKFIPRKFIPQSPPAPPPPAPRQSYAPRPQPRPQPTYGSRPANPPAPVGPFDCFGLQDGDYAKGCSHVYYSCLGNSATERKCPLPSLKYDEDSKSCLMGDFVPACGGAPPPPTTAAPFKPVAKDPRCEGKATGIFEMPGQSCSTKFLSCNDGFGMEMDCAAGMKFDVETGSCLGQMYVVACGGQPTLPPTTPLPSTQAPMDPSFVCEGKPDGDYAHPTIQCAYGYYSCVGGIPMPRICPSQDLRFDPAQGLCEEKQYNSVCGGSPRQAQPLPETTVTQIPESEFSCAGLPDGLHDDHYGCSATFYACSGGQPSKFKCAGDLAFDMDSERCLAQDYVKACGGQPTPIPTIVDDVGTPLPPPDVDFDCSVGEGPHSLGCSNQWVVCSFGRPYGRTCSSSALKYDAAIDQCQAGEFVAECGGQATPPPPPATPGPQPVPVDFDCTTKLDGIYPDERQPCSPHFFTCSSGTAAKIGCPEGLFYNVEESACMVSANVPVCKSKLPVAQPRPQPRGYGAPAPPPRAPVFRPAPPQTGYAPAPRPAPRPANPPVFIPRPNPKPAFQFQPRPAPAPKPVFRPKFQQQFQPRPQPAPKQQFFQPRPNPNFRPAFNGYQ